MNTSDMIPQIKVIRCDADGEFKGHIMATTASHWMSGGFARNATQIGTPKTARARTLTLRSQENTGWPRRGERPRVPTDNRRF